MQTESAQEILIMWALTFYQLLRMFNSYFKTHLMFVFLFHTLTLSGISFLQQLQVIWRKKTGIAYMRLHVCLRDLRSKIPSLTLNLTYRQYLNSEMYLIKYYDI